ncbi:MAG: Holliday junction branch migration protein RuvA [Clostridiales bacterium]|nr:Holliday junction branch migration protein RuvA [Clostridiales bacterium]
MISFIRGRASDMTETSLVVEASGVGYEIYMTTPDLQRIQIGEEYKVYTYFHVREDAMQLYGFLAKDDLRVYRLLLAVNGVGPKGALGVLSGISADDLRFAVLSDDVKTLSGVPGIGKKTAQKMILELKDKLNLSDAFEEKLTHVQATAPGNPELQDARKEAAEALTALGYSSTDALRAVRKVDPSLENVEEILREALRNF